LAKKLAYNPLDMLVSGDAGEQSPSSVLAPSQIAANPQQPRRFVDEQAMGELVASVREGGIHEPLIVRQLQDGSYQLVAGSRRLAAAQAVGLTSVPVVVRDYSDAEAEQVALIENLQRSNLRFDDEANALLQLKRHQRLSNEVLGRRIGKSTDYVELRIAAAENPTVLAMYINHEIEQNEIRSAIKSLREPQAAAQLASDPKASDSVAGPRRPPDGWRWAQATERRLERMPSIVSRMSGAERMVARTRLLQLREAIDRTIEQLGGEG